MKKLQIITLIVIASLMFMACPKRSELDKAFSVSANLAKTTEVTARSILALYEQNVISYEQKERIAAKLRIVVTNGKRFHNALSELAEAFGDLEKIPAAERHALDLLLKTDVLTPLAEIIADIAGLPTAVKEKIFAALQMLQIAVATIVTVFDSSVSYEFYKREINYAG